jgi:DNA gyrase/topoisomerase IV subunit A
MEMDGARELYRTGHGRVTIRAKCHVELISGGVWSSVGNNASVSASTGTAASTAASGGGGGGGNRGVRSAIVVTELPYMTNKAGK